MADKEAKIFLGVEGTSQAITNLKNVAGAFAGIAHEAVGLIRFAKDATNAIANIKPFSPTAATNEAEKYRDVVTRIGVAAGYTADQLGGLQDRFAIIGQHIGQTAEEVAAATEEYGRAIGSTKEAIEGIEDLGIASNNSNRSLRDLVKVGAELKNSLGVPARLVGDELRRIGQLADKVGTVGGRTVLAERIAQLGPTLRRYDASSPDKRRQLEAFVAALGGQLPPEQATQAAEGALSALASNPQQIGRYLGKDVLKSGRIDLQALFTLGERVRKSRGQASFLRIFTQLFGDRKAAEAFGQLDPRKLDELAADTQAEEYVRSQRFEFTPEQGAEAAKRFESAESQAAEAAKFRQEGRERDRYIETKAGRLNRAYRQREAVHKALAQDYLEARDEYQASFEGNRYGQAGLESQTGLAGTTAQAAAAAGALYRSQTKDDGQAAVVDLLREQNDILKNQPAQIGQQLRDDPNNLGVDKARSRPAN